MSLIPPTETLESWTENYTKTNLQRKNFDIFQCLQSNKPHDGPDSELLVNQPEITILMRAILIDWMVEVCVDFRLKRDTFYLAINYLDRYLSVTPNIPKWQFQLIGITSLFIAAKYEEIYAPPVKNFARSTDDGYSTEQIIEMELSICKALKWKLSPTTLYALTNSYMSWWDEVAKACLNEASGFQSEGKSILFKEKDRESYKRFREVTQILDLLLLNNQTFQYHTKALVASLIYLVMGKAYSQFTENDILSNNCLLMDSLDEIDAKRFNRIFAVFLKDHLNLDSNDLLSCIEYVRGYFAVELCAEPPRAINHHSSFKFKDNYEEFLSFQTHSLSNLPFIKGVLEEKL